MHTNRIIFKFQRVSINPSRSINFLQKCKDCLNALMKNASERDKICKVSESCCSSRGLVEELSQSHEPVTVPTAPRHSPNVVVIGAGMAGLSAANHLQDNGIDNITVLEALDGPGGRIRSCWFGDSVVELGSLTSKDPSTNPIVTKVFEDGFTTPQLNQADHSRGLLLRSDGSVIPYPITCEVYEIFKQIWAQAYEESERGTFSVMSFIGSRIEQEIRTFPSKHQIDAERVFHGLFSMATVRSNHDSSLITSSNFGDFVQLPGSNKKVPLGYFGEINTLYESLCPNKVRFGKNVTKIRWGGVSDVFPRAIVICEDGESFQADFVVITIPLGVLKALYESLFCPGLPASKLEAILKIPTGHTNRIFVEFAEPFWSWKRDLCKQTFDAESMECKEGWLKGLSSLQPIRGSNHVMCLTVAGPQAQCMECLSDQEVLSDVSSFLKEFFKKKVPNPVKIKRTGWSCDPHFYGSYSYMGPGVSSKDFYNLASPLPEHTDLCDPVLLFAGESTCPVYFGTVKGAKASGIREAERLLQLVRFQEDKNLCQSIGFNF